MFYLIKKNRFGDCQYGMSDTGDCSPKGIFTIKQPTADLLNKYEGSVIKTYSGVPYLLSEDAVNMIPDFTDYTGTMCVIRVENTFLLVADNKPYIQNCQGSRDKNDPSPVDNILRELYEETKLSPSKDRLKEIGYWVYDNLVELVDTVFECKTIIFLLECSKEEVSHITTDISSVKAINSGIEIYDFKSEEIEFVVTIPADQLDNLPGTIRGKRCSGHIELLRHIQGLSPKPNISYLKKLILLI